MSDCYHDWEYYSKSIDAVEYVCIRCGIRKVVVKQE